ncbi:MAG: hypothetical protein ACI4N5_00700 [Christensenellales bacterium]
MMKRVAAALLALMMILALSACGGKGEDVTGKYLCVSAKYSDGSGTPDGEWIELKKGGKGTYYSGFEFDLKWKLDGEAFTGKVTFMGMETPMEGTLEGGVLKVKYGDMDMSFAKEGAQGSGTATPADDGIVGSYELDSATIDGTDYTYEQLDSYGMAKGTFLKFNADGTGELGLSGEEPESFTYDEATGGITFDSDGSTAIFTVEGDNVTLDYEEAGMTMVFVPEDAAGSLSSTGSSTGANAGAGDFFNGITVAATMDDAFAGAGGGISSGASGFVSPTNAITLGKMWFGVMQVTDSTDNKDYEKDIIASIAATRDGRAFIEVYTDSSMSDDSLQLSMYIILNDDRFAADIGDKDAWVFDRYLTEDDAAYFSPVLENGALDMYYHYEDPDDDYACNVRFFLREDGTPWDEENDPLPPSYDRYKEAIEN